MTISKRNHRQTRIFLWVFALPTLSLLGAIILAHCNRRDEAKQYQQTVEAIFEQWERDNRGKMVSIGSVEVGKWLANLTLSVELTPTQLRELEDAIGGFYKCYSQSTFDVFKAYRLRWPFELDTNGLAKLKNYIPQGFSTADSQKVLEQIWASYAATNVLLSINPASIKLTVEKLSDRRSAGIYPRATNYVIEVAVGYLPRVVSTHPTAKEIYQDQGYIVCATVEQFVTTSANPGSVDPLFVSFYWVEKYGKWLPYEIGRITGDFRTIF